MARVDLSKVQKRLKKVPQEIVVRLMRWIRTIEEFGLSEARKVKGYHDESLKGLRQGQRSVRLGQRSVRLGQRSVRLGQKWRVIYRQSKSGEINIVVVEEVTSHDYRTK